MTSNPTATATETASPTATATTTPGVIILSNNSWFVDLNNKLQIVGEIQNTGLANIQFAEITANVFNASNQLVGVGSTFTFLLVIPPSQRTCFHISMTQPSSWAYYQFEGTYFTGGATSPVLTALNVSVGYDSFGVPEILGQVRNDGNTRANSVRVVGTLYSANQTVIGCDAAYVSSNNLDPGQASSFVISFYPHTYPPVDSFKLQEYGNPQ